MTWKLLARAPSLPKDSEKNVGLRQFQLISFSLSPYRQPSILNYIARVVLNNRAGRYTWWRLQDDSHKYKKDITSSAFKVRRLAAVTYFVTTKHVGFPFHFIPEKQKKMKQPFFYALGSSLQKSWADPWNILQGLRCRELAYRHSYTDSRAAPRWSGRFTGWHNI